MKAMLAHFTVASDLTSGRTLHDGQVLAYCASIIYIDIDT